MHCGRLCVRVHSHVAAFKATRRRGSLWRWFFSWTSSKSCSLSLSLSPYLWRVSSTRIKNEVWNLSFDAATTLSLFLYEYILYLRAVAFALLLHCLCRTEQDKDIVERLEQIYQGHNPIKFFKGRFKLRSFLSTRIGYSKFFSQSECSKPT